MMLQKLPFIKKKFKGDFLTKNWGNIKFKIILFSIKCPKNNQDLLLISRK